MYRFAVLIVGLLMYLCLFELVFWIVLIDLCLVILFAWFVYLFD